MVSNLLNEYYDKWFVSWILVAVVTLIIIIIVFKCYKKDKINLNLYNMKVSYFVKVSLIMEAISLLSRSLLNTSIIKNTFNSIFNYGIELTVVSSILICILDKVWFYKNESNISLINIFLDFTIYVMYFFMVVSGYFGAKYFLNLFFWQFDFISFKFLINHIKEEKLSQNDEDELYPSRNNQLKNLVKIIENAETNEDVVIAIKGQWGYGKSKLLDKLVNEYKEENYYIYIKPMMIDNREILLNEFKMKLKDIMSENGIYSGANSSLEKYFKVVMQLFQLNNKISLNELINISDSNSSYRQLKKNIQKDIELLLSGKKKDEEKKHQKKLVIIIDDFDRIEEKIQMDILAFMNDIVDFKGCIGILSLDYENIKKMERQKKNKLITINYLEKFISDPIELSHVNFKELVKFHSKFIFKDFASSSDYVNKVFNEVKDNICNYYDEFKSVIEKEIDIDNKIIKDPGGNDENKLKVEDKLNYENDFFNNSCKITDNARKVKYFLNELKRNVGLLSNYKQNDSTEKIFNRINFSKVIYLFSFINVFYQEIYDEIIRFNGVEEFLYYYNNKKYHNKEWKYGQEDYVVDLIIYTIPNCNNKTNVLYSKLDLLENRVNSRASDEDKITLKLYYDLIKDIFINYKFISEKFNLLTQNDRLVNDVDENKIDIEKNYIKKLNMYMDAIFQEKEEDKIEERLYNLMTILESKLNNDEKSKSLISIMVKLNTINGSADYKIKYINPCLNYIISLFEENVIDYTLVDSIDSYVNELDIVIGKNYFKYIKFLFKVSQNDVAKLDDKNNITDLEEYVVKFIEKENFDEALNCLIDDISNKEALGERVMQMLQRKKSELLQLKTNLAKLKNCVEEFQKDDNQLKNREPERILDELAEEPISENYIEKFHVVMEGILKSHSNDVDEDIKLKIKDIYARIFNSEYKLEDSKLIDVCSEYYDVMAR